MRLRQGHGRLFTGKVVMPPGGMGKQRKLLPALAGKRPHLPQRLAAVQPEAGEPVGIGNGLQRSCRDVGPPHDVGKGRPGRAASTRPAAGGDTFTLAGGKSLDQPQPQPQRMQPVAIGRVRLQRAVPAGMADIGRTHGDAAAARLGDELRGGIEPHRLGVQQRADKDIGIMPLDPGRDIDKQREARRMRFRKTVGAEPLDLPETALGEFRLIATRDHAADHLVVEFGDIAMFLEGGHGAAQLVGLASGEAGTDNGDLHRLLLEQRHAKGAFENAAKRVRGIGDLFEPGAAAKIGMHHVALNRSRADNRHLHDKVMETARLQARQHGHLRP